MPPYAGLDELHHVARLAFVLAEGRNPTIREPSIPRYLERSLAGEAAALPDFASLAERWPAWLRGGARALAETPLVEASELAYGGVNYEAQQPSLYYTLVAPGARLVAPRTALAELRLWRLASVLFGTLTVLAAGWTGWRSFGPAGLLAAALVPLSGTWLTLVARASNDALCCALLAIGVAVTMAGPRRWAGSIVEALAWAGAVATKLYAWPVLILLPLAWRSQRAPRWRIVAVAGAVALAGALTVADLAQRTRNPLGLFAFDAAERGAPASVSIDVVAAVKIWLATAAWTSGQHWNALRGPAMILYALPVLAFLAFGLVALWRRDRRAVLWIGAVVAAFAFAQLLNTAAFVRAARAEGLALPAGGKEAWYWFCLVPILVLLPAAGFARRAARRVAPFAVTLWLVAWDLRIAEGGLFRDYAGLTSPETPSWIFRWGPSAGDDGSESLAVGPLAEFCLELRVLHLTGLILLLALLLWPRAPEAALSSGASRPESSSPRPPGPAPGAGARRGALRRAGTG